MRPKPPRLSHRVHVLLALASSGVACVPDDPCLWDIGVDGLGHGPAPSLWTVTLCLAETCSSVVVSSESAEPPDVTGTLFEPPLMVGFRDDGTLSLRGHINFGERSGDVRVSLEIRDHDTGELVLFGAFNERPGDEECLYLDIDKGQENEGGSPER